jgi:hypothetical protein
MKKLACLALLLSLGLMVGCDQKKPTPAPAKVTPAAPGDAMEGPAKTTPSTDPAPDPAGAPADPLDTPADPTAPDAAPPATTPDPDSAGDDADAK